MARIWRGIRYASCGRFAKAELIPLDPSYIEVERPVRGKVCPQSLRKDNLLPSVGVECDENSLYLSVYAPSSVDPQEFGKIPVMVWIHGGRFLNGGSEESRYSLSEMADRGHMIMVAISYRLGVFGYLYMPERGVVNLGLEDQKAGLRWVKENVGVFGGDPSKVTVFGQSAGAQSIAALIATDGGEHLFDKAVLQSAPLGLKMNGKMARRVASTFISELGGLDPYTASMEQMLAAQDRTLKKLPMLGMCFAPVVDCDAVPSEKGWPTAVVAGHAAQDAMQFAPRHVVGAATRLVFDRPVKRYLASLEKNGTRTSAYLVRWFPEGSRMKACHCIELPFLLGEWEDWNYSRMLPGVTEEQFRAGRDKFIPAWAEFAHTGIFPYQEY